MVRSVNKTALIIPHYHSERHINVDAIISSVEKWEKKPDQVIIFNNFDSREKLRYPQRWVTEIHSDFNFGSSVRYSIAAACGADIIVCQDDDLLLPEYSFHAICGLVEANPKSVIGFCGANIGAPLPYMNRESMSLEGSGDYCEVDIVIGRVTAFHKQTLQHYFRIISTLDFDYWKNHEDIPLSLANQEAGNKNILYGFDIENLSENGCGLSHQADHFTHRDALTQLCLEIKSAPSLGAIASPSTSKES